MHKKKKNDIKPHDMHRGFFMKISTKETKNKQTKGKENTTLTLRIYFFTELQRLEIECQTVDTIPAPQVFKPCSIQLLSLLITAQPCIYTTFHSGSLAKTRWHFLDYRKMSNAAGLRN